MISLVKKEVKSFSGINDFLHISCSNLPPINDLACPLLQNRDNRCSTGRKELPCRSHPVVRQKNNTIHAVHRTRAEKHGSNWKRSVLETKDLDSNPEVKM